MNFPYPDCTADISDCQDLDVINTLDGFGLQTRISIPFDGPIDANTATKETVFLIPLGSTLRREDDHHGDDDINNPVRVIGINQVVWDVPTNTLHVESDELLAQHTRYALIVTDGLRDAAGRPIGAVTAFRRFRQTARGEYKHALLEAIHAARRLGVRERNIVTASVYTTQSITSVMERIRDQIKAGTPAPANFALGPLGQRAVFDFPEIASIVWRPHTGVNPDCSRPCRSIWGFFRSSQGPWARSRMGTTFHPTTTFTRANTSLRSDANRHSGRTRLQRYLLHIASAFRPSARIGWPIALIGGGTSGNQHFTSATLRPSSPPGIATIGINHVGQGFGPLGALTVNMKDGSSLRIPDAGRGFTRTITTSSRTPKAARPPAVGRGQSPPAMPIDKR